MTFALFDVVVVPFPYVDVAVNKRRPALIVSRPEVETEHGWLWLAMITGAPGALSYADAAVTDLASAGLTRPCRVRASKVATLDRTLVLRRVGKLSPVDRDAVTRALEACAGW